MKKYLFLAACCMLAAGFTACSDNDENVNDEPQANNVPNVTEALGIQYPVTSIITRHNYHAAFNYSNGKMTGGIIDSTSTFVITENPLTINISYNYGVDSENTKITDIRTNANGFITSAQYTSLWTNEEGTERRAWNTQIEYDADGHISKLTTNGTGEGYYWTSTSTYTWVNNNLTQQVTHEEFNENNGEQSGIYTTVYSYQYDEDVSRNLNPGIFVENMYDNGYTSNFMWYAGLLGKPTHNIPISVTTKRKDIVNGETSFDYDEQKDINVTYNSNGSVASITYKYDYYLSNTYFFGYGSELPSVKPQSSTTNLRTRTLKSSLMRHLGK